MTDEQLRAMARRIYERELYIDTVSGVECYMASDDEMVGTVEKMEADAVAILREEVAKAQAANYDPTQSFVATTNGIEEQ